MNKRPILTLLCMLPSFHALEVQGQAPKDPVFTIIIEQKGEAEGESFEKSVEARYWPCSIWNSGRFGGLTFGGKSVLGAQTAWNPEAMLAERGSIAGMKPGEVLQLYVREKSGSGKESGGCSAVQTTIGDGVFSWTIKRGDEVKTYTNSREAATPRNRASGPAANADAEILRTPEGAVLTVAEPALEAEGYCDFFSLFELEDLRFELTNEDLKNWATLIKVNDRKLSAPLGGTLHVRATLRGGFVRPGAEVTLDGCFEVGKGGEGKVTASGKPEGGRYRFWADPPSVLQVQGQGSTASISVAAPGRATLNVEYRAPSGKTAQASQPAVAIQVESINEGRPLPKIALFNFEGKQTPGLLSVPVRVRPEGAGDLLSYTPADPAVLSAMNQGDTVVLQGVRLGTTTVQAATKCGGPTGPVATVEVVRCDDEVRLRLERLHKDMMEAYRSTEAEIGRILNDKGFEQASNRLADSAADVLVNTGGLIITALSAGGAAGVQTAAQIYTAGSGVRDVLKGDPLTSAKAVLQTMVQFGKRTVLATAGAGIQAAESVHVFIDHLGRLMQGNSELRRWSELLDRQGREVEDIVRRIRICRTGGEEAPKPEGPEARKNDPPSDKKEPSSTPKKADPQGKTDPPSPPDPPASKAGDKPSEPPPDEPPLPPPPTVEPRRVGLPFDEVDCGCTQSRQIRPDAEGITAMSAGMENMKRCVEQFRDGPLFNYRQALEQLAEVYAEVSAAIETPEAERIARFNAVLPRLESQLKRIEEFDLAGRAFYGEFKFCPENLGAGVAVLRSLPAAGKQ